MKRSEERILTTHVGSLARSHQLLDAMKERAQGPGGDAAAYAQLVRDAVREVVHRQAEVGIDVVTDGEQSKLGFFQYLVDRFDGMEAREGRLSLAPSWQLEVDQFPEYYKQYMSKYSSDSGPSRANVMVCTGPIRYAGHEQLQRDIDNLKAAVAQEDSVTEAFMPSSAPHPFGLNEHYPTQDDYVTAIADALREEYRAIVDAGLILQVDDPFMIDLLMDGHAPDEEAKVVTRHIEFVNYALEGIPAEKVRLHTCFGLNHGPRLHDAPLSKVVPWMLTINAGAYSFEVGNPRHQHEWRVWEDVKLPEGKAIIPGFLCHAHNFVEHPQLIADGIIRYAGLVGRENVIAGADCGFSSRAIYNPEVHPTVVWEKFRALAQGAELASEALWQ